MEILTRWGYRRRWRTTVGVMRRYAAKGHIHALTELRRKSDPDPWREESLRAAYAVDLLWGSAGTGDTFRFIYTGDPRNFDPTQVISDAELEQLVKDKLGMWRDGAWDGKKSCPERPTLEGLFTRPSAPKQIVS